MSILDIKLMSEVLKALADPTRLTIIGHLKKGEMCVCDIVPLLNISQPAVSQHLRKLRKEGILLERRQGNWIYYRLNTQLERYVQAVVDAVIILNEESQSPCCKRT
ncbi:MAG: ArsR/SmtB family transcription factor [Bacilli bacterium]